MTWTPMTPVGLMAWSQPRPMPPSSDGGIDFVYQVLTFGPIKLVSDRPLVLSSTLSEGNP